MRIRQWFCLLVATLLLSGNLWEAQAQKARQANRPLLRAPRGYSRGYSPFIKWRVTLGMSGDTTPAIADLELDGTMDIIVPSVDGPALYRLTQDGVVTWRVDLPDWPTAGVTLGDINRDGALDILLACEKVLLCFDANGKQVWRRTFTEPIDSLPTIADLEGDGHSEVLFGANDNLLHVLDYRGRNKWNFRTKSWITGGVATADIDGDGQLEVGFGSLDFNFYVLNSRGKLRWKYATRDWVQGSVVFADVDRDGGIDLLGASDDGFLYCLSRRGTLKWRGRMGWSGRGKPYLAVGDLDLDGTQETLVTAPDGYLRCFTAWGDRVWQSFDGNEVSSTDEQVALIGSPLIADLNNDRWPEILMVGNDGQLRAFNAWGNTVFQSAVGGSIESSPIIADADRDGKWEVYVGNIASEEGDAGFFSQYEINIKGGRGVWTTIKGDPYRTATTRNAYDYGLNLSRGGDYATAWEPFGLGYRPRSGVQPPRRLRVTALPLQDVNGNRDGALDPGETALFRVQIENLGRGASYDNLLTVNLGRTILRIDRTRSYLGWLAPGARKIATFRLSAPPIIRWIEWQRQEEQRATTPFREVKPASPEEISAGTSTSYAAARRSRVSEGPIVRPVTTRAVRRQPARAVLARLQVLESGVQAAVSQTRVFNMPPLPPVLSIARRQLIDSNSRLTQGNGNGRLEAGESAIMRVWLRNENLTTAQTAYVTLRSNNSDVLVATPTATVRNVVPYGGRQIDFGLRVARTVRNPNVTLTLATQPIVARSAPVPGHVETIKLSLTKVGLDLEPPRFVFASPKSLIATTSASRMAINGIVSDASGLRTFRFDGKDYPVKNLQRVGNGRYRFAFWRALKVGENVFALNAADTRGNATSQSLRIVRKPAPTR